MDNLTKREYNLKYLNYVGIDEAEKAAANADKAYMSAINMNAEQYLRMKEIDNQKLAIERGSNVTVIMGGGVPLINTK